MIVINNFNIEVCFMMISCVICPTTAKRLPKSIKLIQVFCKKIIFKSDGNHNFYHEGDESVHLSCGVSCPGPMSHSIRRRGNEPSTQLLRVSSLMQIGIVNICQFTLISNCFSCHVGCQMAHVWNKIIQGSLAYLSCWYQKCSL